MQAKTAFVLLAAITSASAVGCGSSSSNSGGTIGTVRASLHRAKSCGDLLGDLKNDAIYKLNKGISRQIEAIQACQQKYSDTQCASYGGYASFGDDAGGRGSAESATAGAVPPSAPNPVSDSSKSADPSAQSYSETNTQVKGVDEADIVKNDGKNLYILHGRSLKVLNAWPANDLREVGSLDVEGTPTEMFVADGQAVIYSQVNGTAVFAAAGVSPKQQYQDWGYSGGRGGMTDGAARAPMPYDTGNAGPYTPLTKITVAKFEGTTPSVTREVYFEGSYLDARRVGPHVRTVFQGYQYGPKLKYSIYELYPQNTATEAQKEAPDSPSTYTNPYPKTGSEMITALEKLRAENISTLGASQLADWLPYTFLKNGAAVSAKTVACEDFYVPTVGSTTSGLTEVVSLDLSDPASTPKETAIVGRADTVYANAETLYVAAQAWVEPPFVWSDPGATTTNDGVASSPPNSGTATPIPEDAPETTPKPGAKPASVRPLTTPTPPSSVITWSSTNTHLHKFEFASQPTFPNYVASGTVKGAVKDQFSLDEKDGFLRIATTENRQYVTTAGQYVSADFSPPSNGTPAPVRPSTVNHVFVLEQKGAWLDLTGDGGELAPNEQIYSVRFLGKRGYVVTFRQVDPLFVFDLATPSKPQLLAALKIPGFSEYMHPLDENHLLTIGRDASSSGRAQGLQLQIFDVTNGSNPIVKHKFTYAASEYGSSEAEYDHKAFTYFADKNLLAFPFLSYGSSMRSSLELFKIDLGTGFAKLGSIDHTALVSKNPNGYCGGSYGPGVRRGVFMENFVYSISYGGVVVKDSNDLVATGSELALPSPVTNEGYGPACY